jgi:predicted RNA binding protein YcfA (HicA-like mRNA interferase family)
VLENEGEKDLKIGGNPGTGSGVWVYPLTGHVIMALVKVRDLIRRLEDAGWTLKTVRGSHRQYRHPEKGMVVTVPGHPGKDVPVGTLKAILRSAGLEGRD